MEKTYTIVPAPTLEKLDPAWLLKADEDLHFGKKPKMENST